MGIVNKAIIWCADASSHAQPTSWGVSLSHTRGAVRSEPPAYFYARGGWDLVEHPHSPPF
eukprot:2445564-Amphidinium_carterae.1